MSVTVAQAAAAASGGVTVTVRSADRPSPTLARVRADTVTRQVTSHESESSDSDITESRSCGHTTAAGRQSHCQARPATSRDSGRDRLVTARVTVVDRDSGRDSLAGSDQGPHDNSHAGLGRGGLGLTCLSGLRPPAGRHDPPASNGPDLH